MKRRRPEIGIVTVTNDLHALAIAKELEQLGAGCHIFEADSFAGTDGLTWGLELGGSTGRMHSRAGAQIQISNLDVVWWRRLGNKQILPSPPAEASDEEVVNNCARAALLGLFETCFTGIWISEPNATSRAENKLIQLREAKEVGLRVPETLVSQDPDTIRKFCQRHEGQIIVKPLRGAKEIFIFARKLRPEHIADDASLRLCPTIFQKLIEGTDHIRALAFGDHVLAAKLTSHDLDWRGNLQIPFEHYELELGLKDQLLALLKRLRLRMGVFDLKIGADGLVNFLEVNPQGQFLFLEPLTELKLSENFAEFLFNCAI